MRMRAPPTCLLLAVLSVVVSQVTAVIIPQPPSQYGVIVSSNSGELGATFAYKEYYNSTRGLLRTDISGITNIFNTSSGVLQSYNNTDGNCTAYDLTPILTTARFLPYAKPSIGSFNSYVFDTDNTTFCIGTTNDVRDIPAYHFQTREPTVNGNITVVDFFFSVATKLPIRMIRSAYRPAATDSTTSGSTSGAPATTDASSSTGSSNSSTTSASTDASSTGSSNSTTTDAASTGTTNSTTDASTTSASASTGTTNSTTTDASASTGTTNSSADASTTSGSTDASSTTAAASTTSASTTDASTTARRSYRAVSRDTLPLGDRIYQYYVDWVNWEIRSDSSIFSQTSVCTNSTDLSAFEMNVTKANIVELPENAPFPILSQSFYVALEGRFAQNGQYQRQAILPFDWYYNADSRVERADVSLSSSGTYDYTYIYDHKNNIEYDARTAVGDSGCSLKKPVGTSVVASSGVGVVHKMFTGVNSTLNGFDTTNAKYKNHTTVRGVTADTWVITGLSNIILDPETKLNVNFTFDSTFYFFPNGWQFLRRNTLTTGVVPMRVVNNGTKTFDNGTSVAYDGEWDFFLYENSKPVDALLDPTKVGCSIVPTNTTDLFRIPEQYSVFVSFNILTTGLTFAYEELADSKTNLTRYYVYGGDQTIVDLNEPRIYRFFPYNSDQRCKQDYFNTSDPYQPFSPSYKQFKSFNISGWQNNGTSTDVRTILANHYKYENVSSGFTEDLYVDVVSLYPIRYLLNGTFNGTQITLAIDYIDWVPSKPVSSVFTKPTDCVNETIKYGRMSDKAYTPPAENATLPTVPNQFFVVLEGKLPVDGNDDDDSKRDTTTTQELVGAEWFYDANAQLERYEALAENLTFTSTFTYANDSAYILDGEDCLAFSSKASSLNAFVASGTGFLHDFFDPSFSAARVQGFDRTKAVYNGTTVLRGVVGAPKWIFSNLSSHYEYFGADGSVPRDFYFSSTVYYYPEGWSFPGRNITSERVPLRLEQVGYYTTAGVTEPTYFTETWDFFAYYPAAPLASSYVPCTASTVPTPVAYTGPNTTSTTTTTTTTTTSTSFRPGSTTTTSGIPVRPHKGLSGGAKAAIAIVVIISILGLLVGVYLVIRKSRQQPRRGNLGMNTENRTFEPMHDQEDL